MFKDLREFIAKSEALGEVRHIEGAGCDREIGDISDVMANRQNTPLLVFDKIPGYPEGWRVASNIFNSQKRTAIGLDFPFNATKMELVRILKERIAAGVKPLPPVEVAGGPVKENVDTGDKIDLWKFPTPKWHERDGGRYIGTGTIGIMRDPDSGFINFGSYRTQIHDKSTVTLSMGPGHHGALIRQKYWDRGQNAPIAIACGQDPALFAASHWEKVPWGMSEYDWAGWLRGVPVEVTRGVATDLPIPATAEIVIEGEIVPFKEQTITEGPFGEWWGYLSGERLLPACRVKSVLYRNNPIIQGCAPSIMPSTYSLGGHIQKAASLWVELERHVPGVTGVWAVEEAALHTFPVIALKQQYGGHAKQAALIAAGCSTSGWASRIILVVDDDIDPSDMSQVIWALATRIDPKSSIDIIQDCWTAQSDPMLSPEHKRLKQLVMSRALITAVKPYWWADKFPPTNRLGPEGTKRVIEKWGKLLGIQ